MTRTETERLAVLEEKLDSHVENQKIFEADLRGTLGCMDKKLDNAIFTKADRTELQGKADKEEFIFIRNLVILSILVSVGLMLLNITLNGAR